MTTGGPVVIMLRFAFVYQTLLQMSHQDAGIPMSIYDQQNQDAVPDHDGSERQDQTVFIIDDDDDLRKSLTFMLESFRLKIKAFASAIAFLEDLDPHADGCAIIDIRMPGMDGIELQEQLIKLNAMFPVLILTAEAEVPQVVEAMKNGAHHLLLKSAQEEQIVERVFKALDYSRELQKKNRDIIQTANLILSLSPREKEVLDLVIDGFLSREIAEKLKIKIKTVEAHRGNMMGKMGTSNVAELIHKILEFRASNHKSEK